MIRDQAVKRAISEVYEEARADTYRDRPPSASGPRQPLSAAPVLIVACVDTPASGQAGFQTGASIYPSVQNLMLAARALGLGTVLTTLHRRRQARNRQQRQQSPHAVAVHERREPKRGQADCAQPAKPQRGAGWQAGRVGGQAARFRLRQRCEHRLRRLVQAHKVVDRLLKRERGSDCFVRGRGQSAAALRVA